MGRQRRLLAKAVTLVALTAAFAASTAVFNSTYQQQAEVDARLTNGADVTVTESPGVRVGPQGAAQLAAVPGVESVEPLQHRFAYVGADLQDLYGVRPQTDRRRRQAAERLVRRRHAPSSSCRRSRNGPTACSSRPRRSRTSSSTRATCSACACRTAGRSSSRPSRSTTSASPRSSRPRPKDSFFVANPSYVAQATGSDAVGAFLVQTDGTEPGVVAQRLQRAARHRAPRSPTSSTSARSSGPTSPRSSSPGLTKVELGFALVARDRRLRASRSGSASRSAGGRSRSPARSAPRRRQLGGFVWGESLFVTVGGLLLGDGRSPSAISDMLVKVLTGVFDPPPDALSVPWAYLGAVARAHDRARSARAGALTLRALRRPAIEELRDL